MKIPLLGPDLVARIVKSENDGVLSRVNSVQRVDGNPLGVVVRKFNHVLATLMRAHPETWWNRVAGNVPGDENLFDEI